jgi:hypothetical protein
MAQRGVKGIRAAWLDATAKLAQAVDPADPPPEAARVIDGREILPGAWDGYPTSKLPPGCSIVPLGVQGKTSFFIDSTEQLIAVDTNEWGKKMLIQLFATRPNLVAFYWPRWSAPKGNKPSVINGVEVDDACACLMRAASLKGLFDPVGRVRGRGAWSDRHGRLIWHSGEALWTVHNGKLKRAAPGEVDGIFYPRRPEVMTPWPEPVDPSDTPAHKIFACLKSWTWERGDLDPVIMLGAIGVMLLGGALDWRPHVAATGDAGVGKSQLNMLLKGAMGHALIDAGNTTEAGVRQHMGLDSLPVAIDEFEGSEDNRRVNGILELARIASSGARMLRGGADHKGVEFQARNAFFCSGINLPPMKPQDKSRFAVLNLGKLQVPLKDGKAVPPPAIGEHDGRMILRALMDAWHDFPRAFGDWRMLLRGSGLDSRAQDTYGTLFAVAELLLGQDALEDAGLGLDAPHLIGDRIAQATASERAERLDNWRACLEHLLGVPIEAWKGGEKPSVGGLIERLEDDEDGTFTIKHARDRLAAAGLGLIEEADPALPHGKRRYVLAVPATSPALARLFQHTRWQGGGWSGALRQGRTPDGPQIVRREAKIVKINRVAVHCVMVDLTEFDREVSKQRRN